MKGVVMGEDGSRIAERQAPTAAGLGSADVMRRMRALIMELHQASGGAAGDVGVTVPGILSADGVVQLLPNFPDRWQGIRLEEQLGAATGLAVRVLNDGRAAAYGEKRFGAGQPYANFICLVIGTGIGGGIIIDHRLYQGSGGTAGEFGHQTIIKDGELCGCGNRGCLETVASGRAIMAMALRCLVQGSPTALRELVQGDLNRVTPQLVDAAAANGDRLAMAIMERAASAIAQGLRNLICILNPVAAVIGGGVARSDLLLALIRRKLKEHALLGAGGAGAGGEWEFPLHRARHIELSGAAGAAAWALSAEAKQ